MRNSSMCSGLKVLVFVLLSVFFLDDVALAESQARWSMKLRIAVPAGDIALRGSARAKAEVVDPVVAKMEAAGMAVRLREAAGDPDIQAYDLEASSSGSVDRLRRLIYKELKPQVNILGGVTELNVTSSGARSLASRVVIAANPSTGYLWMVADGSGYIESTPGNFVMHTRGVGVPQHQVLHLRNPDNTNGAIKLVYRRPWEPAAARLRIDVELDSMPEQLDLSDPDVPAAPAALPPKGAASSVPFPAVERATLPTSWDWRTSGIVTPVRNQDMCGGCWAFGTVGIMESALWKNGTPNVDLSEQFLISCNTSGWDCDGGLTAHIYHFNKLGRNQSVIGAVLEADKPFTGTNGTCSQAYNHPQKLSGWQFIVPTEFDMPTVEEIKSAIYTYGPVTAGVCVGSGLSNYTGGVFSTDETDQCNGGTNHQIILVGWNDNGGNGYWIMRNSWGPTWGIDGYMHIKYNTSRVGEGTSWVTTAPVNPTFTIKAVPPAVEIRRGGSGDTSISTTAIEGFSSAVTLSATGLPSGVTASFSPATIAAPGSGSSTLTFNVSAQTAPGSFPVRIVGTGGGESNETTVTLTVTTGANTTLLSEGFEGVQWPFSRPSGTSAGWSIVSTGTHPQGTPHGGYAMAQFNSYDATPGDEALIHHTNSFSIPASASTVTFKFWMYHDTGYPNLPDSMRPCISTDGENYTPLAPATARYDGTTGWAEVSVDLGSYKGESAVLIGFLGTSAYGNNIYLDDISVVAAEDSATPGLSIAALPTTVFVPKGSSGSATVTTTVSGGFSSAVTLSATGLPSGVTASFSPASIAAPGSGTSTVTFNVSAAAAAGSYPVKIVGAGGGQNRESTITLTVTTGTGTTLFSDGFEESQWLYFQPTGTTASWSIVSTGTDPEVTPHGGSSMTEFNSFDADSGNNALTHHTNSFAIPAGAGTVTLKFWMYHDTGYPGAADSLRPYISTDGDNYTALAPAIARYDGSSGWAEVSVDLGSYKGESSVLIGFLGTSDYGNNIYLDDVSVVATGASTPVLSIGASPAAVTVPKGGTGSTTISATVSGGFSSAVTLSTTGLPSGVTATFNPATIAAPGSGSASLTFTAATNAAAGSYQVTVTGAGGGATRTATVTVTVTATPPLTLTAAPATIAAAPGETKSSVLTTSGTNGFSSAVTLAASGQPAGVTVTLSPATIAAPGSGTSTVTFRVAVDAVPGSYQVKLTATGGGTTQETGVTLVVGEADALFSDSFEGEGWTTAHVSGTEATWSLAGSGNHPSAAPHGGNTLALFNSYDAISGSARIYRSAGFPIPASAGKITLKFWMRHDTEYTADDRVQAQVSTDGSSWSDVGTPVMRYDWSNGWSKASVDLTPYKGQPNVRIGFLGTSDYGNDIYLDDVTVEAGVAGDFAIAASSATLTVARGGRGTATVTTTPSAGFGDAIDLAISGLPNGVVAAFTPATIAAPGSGSASAVFRVSSTAQAGSYPVTITGTGGGVTKTALVTLAITDSLGSFTMAAAPVVVTLAQGGRSSTTLTTTVSGGFNSAVTLSVTGLPAGMTAALSGATIPAPGTGAVSVTFSVSANLAAGTYPVTLVGTAGGVTRQTTVTLIVTAAQGSFFSIPGLGTYQSFGSMYSAAAGSGTIVAYAGSRTLMENLTFDKDLVLVIRGGYNSTFTSVTGASIINGTLLVRRGKLIVERIAVK